MALVFLVLGLFSLAFWIQGGTVETYHLLMGLGFLFSAPNAYFNPIEGNSTLRELFRARSRKAASNFPRWLDVTGTLLLIAGLVARCL